MELSMSQPKMRETMEQLLGNLMQLNISSQLPTIDEPTLVERLASPDQVEGQLQSSLVSNLGQYFDRMYDWSGVITSHRRYSWTPEELDFLKAGFVAATLYLNGLGEKKTLAEAVDHDPESLLTPEQDQRYKNCLVTDTLAGDQQIRRYRMSLASARAVQSAMAHQIKESAITDSLTGVYSRSYINSLLEEEFRRAQQRSHGLTLLHFDINGLGELNIKEGYSAGDKLIRTFSEATRREMNRPADKLGREGGDEFYGVLPYLSPDHLEETLSRMNATIDEAIRAKFPDNYRADEAVIAIGAAAYPETANTVAEIIKRSEEAGCLSKLAGKIRRIPEQRIQRLRAIFPSATDQDLEQGPKVYSLHLNGQPSSFYDHTRVLVTEFLKSSNGNGHARS